MVKIRKKRDTEGIIGYLNPEMIDIHGNWYQNDGTVHNLLGFGLVLEVDGVEITEEVVSIGYVWWLFEDTNFHCHCGAKLDPLTPLLLLESISLYPSICCGRMSIKRYVSRPIPLDFEDTKEDDYWRMA